MQAPSIYRVSQSVSVIIPALNEARNLPAVLTRIPAWVSEVVLVDGHSSDDTVQIAQKLLPGIRVIMQEGCCKGDALRRGLAAATGEIIVMLDADGSTDPAEMGMFVRLLRNGADFVKGSRFLQGAGTPHISHLRRWGDNGLTMLVRWVVGSSLSAL